MSDDIERCETCSGRKKIVGLGNMEKKCSDCNGIGWIKKEDENASTKGKKQKSKRSKFPRIEESPSEHAE